ncbi:MAG: hypothetical protein PHY73_01405 [Candidatus Omnitrophica bacterium]|nr:hypothetical protein [Candidatus Omnitrophota bacterium]
MRLKRLDPQYRKEKILTYVVSRYIQYITPVSSNQIVEERLFDLSPATIRNILAELEEDGFLTHPHTSAGRIPTQDGYRYYVDHLMEEIDLLAIEKQRILAEYSQGVLELEALLKKTSEILAQETRYPAIISIDGYGDKTFCRGISFVAGYPEFHNFQKIERLVHLLEEKERILEIINRDLERKIHIYIGDEAGCSDMEGCSLIVSRYGNENGPKGSVALLGPTRMNYEKAISNLEYFTELIDEMLIR